jgi:hypothetical protein
VPHIDVSARSDQTLTLADGQILQGIGEINGNLIVSSGAAISPGGTNSALGIVTGANPTGVISAANNIGLAGMTIIKLDGTTNDVVQAGADLVYGGDLNLVNISGMPLLAGNTFQIFSAANYSGSFSSITPAMPGPGLAWDASELGSGIIGVVTANNRPVFGLSSISGGQMIFNGTGGLTNGIYYVLAATNLTTPLTNWCVIATNQFYANGNFSWTNTHMSGNPQEFFIIKQ